MAANLHFTCVICGQDNLSETDMKHHLQTEHSTSESSYCCPICDVSCDTSKELNVHIDLDHADLFTPVKKSSNTTNDMDCTECTPIKTQSELVDEIVTYTPDTSIIRNLGFTTPKAKLQVNKETQTCDQIVYEPPSCLVTEYKCPLCAYRTITSYDIQQHVDDTHFDDEMGDNTTSVTSQISSDEIMTPNSLDDYHCNFVHIPDETKGDVDCQIATSDNDTDTENFVNIPNEEYTHDNTLLVDLNDGSDVNSNGQEIVKQPLTEEDRNIVYIPSSISSQNLGQTNDNMTSRTTTSDNSNTVITVNGGACSDLISFEDNRENTKPGCIFNQTTTRTTETNTPNSDDLISLNDASKLLESSESNDCFITGCSTVKIPQTTTVSSSTTFNRLYDCPFCGNSYDSLTSVEVHIERAHPSGDTRTDTHTDMEMDTQTCPMCGFVCDNVDVMTDHVNGHFDGSAAAAQNASTSQQTPGVENGEKSEPTQTPSNGSYRSQGEQSLSRAMYRGDMTIAQYYHHKSQLQQENTLGVDDGHSCTKGIMGRLNEYYHSLPPHVTMVRLCPNVHHYAGSLGDKGWGCGYRNLQMILSALATDDTYRDVLFNGTALIPSIPKIQRLIETAWQKGFDRQGAKQLNNRLVNTNKWIGATDLMATLQSLRVKCKLIDFHSPSSPDGTHPKLFQWVASYFSQHSCPAFLPPLLLQHQGHSRTIVGVEHLSDGATRILLFDPGSSKSQMEKLKKKVTSDTLKSVRRGLVAFKAKQYQVLAVVGVIDNAQYDQYKILKSERV